MNLVRNASILTGGEIEELSSIKKFPVFIGSTEENLSTDIFSDLTFDICKETGIIQLRNLVDPSIVYSKFHSEAVGEIWNTHHALLGNLISKYGSNKNILEIGGSDSKLAINTLKLNKDIKEWTIIEPIIKNNIIHNKLKYIKTFFDERIIIKKQDLIVHSHVLEHMLDPKTFLKHVSNIIGLGDYHIFSVPNLYKYLKNKFVNTINFEHTILLTEDFIDYLLSINSFKIIDKQYYGDHSIFYITQKAKVEHKKLPNKYSTYKKLYLDFFNYYKKFIEKLNIRLEKTNKNVYLFGGHIFSQYLISLGLNTQKIKFILDNSELKNNKRLYGSNLIIKSPNNVNLYNSLIILKVGQYKDEIKNQLINLNPNIEFYE